MALLGPNGAGKTSTVEALEGYRQVDGGSVRVLGLDPAADHAALVPRIGVMLQKGGVYPMLGPAQVLDLFAALLRRPRGPRGPCSTWWGCPGSGARRGGGCPAGSSSGCRWPWPWWASPTSCSSTSPPPVSTPRDGSSCATSSPTQRDRGICVILTTHELAEAERLADQVVIIDHGRELAEGTPGANWPRARPTARSGSPPDPGIDTAALAAAVGPGTTVDEERPGSYRLVPPSGSASPPVVAALAGWLAERDLSLGDLRTGQSLEEAYLAITGSSARREPGPADGAPD